MPVEQPGGRFPDLQFPPCEATVRHALLRSLSTCGGRAASGIATAAGSAVGRSWSGSRSRAGGTRPAGGGAVRGVDDRALVLPGAGGAAGPGGGIAPPTARRCRTRAGDVSGADRRAARSVPSPSVVVRAAPPAARAVDGRRAAYSKTASGSSRLSDPSKSIAVRLSAATAPSIALVCTVNASIADCTRALPVGLPSPICWS